MKNIIYYFVVTYIFIILILLGINFINRTNAITFQSYNEYEENIKLIDSRVANLEDNDCTIAIQRLVKKSKDTYFVGKLSLKDMEKQISLNDEYWLSIYGDVKKLCNVDNEDIDDYVLSASLVYEDIRDAYMFNYELSFTDFENRELSQPMLISIKNKIRKDMEIKTIISILDEVE